MLCPVLLCPSFYSSLAFISNHLRFFTSITTISLPPSTPNTRTTIRREHAPRAQATLARREIAILSPRVVDHAGIIRPAYITGLVLSSRTSHAFSLVLDFVPQFPRPAVRGFVTWSFNRIILASFETSYTLPRTPPQLQWPDPDSLEELEQGHLIFVSSVWDQSHSRFFFIGRKRHLIRICAFEEAKSRDSISRNQASIRVLAYSCASLSLTLKNPTCPTSLPTHRRSFLRSDMLRSRRFYLSLLGVAAWSTAAAGTIYSILDAASLSSKHVSFLGLLVTACSFNVVGLCCVGLFSVQYAWKRDGVVKGSSNTRRVLATACIGLSAVALVLSLASIITIQTRGKEIPADRRSTVSNWPWNLSPQFAVWALACLCQIVLYTSPLWSKSANVTEQNAPGSGPRDSVMSEVRNSNQTTSLHLTEATMPSSPLAALPSPTFSSRSSYSLKSWKSSLNHVIHPVSSRTKLITRPSFARDARSVYSDSPSIDNVSQADGFDTWDTSSVDPQARDTVLQTAPTRGTTLGTALEPIPGSRPASPAHALDGPFLEVSDGRASPALSLPPKMHPDMSRPPSPAVSEAHIHPLFRTESPVPPPEATPGTSILASPLSNQAISCPPRPYSRMRSNSRTTSPSLLMHSQSLQDLSKVRQRSSRSPSPPSREMTPPIPDFVLNSSPRSSMSGTHSRRKINLHVETSR